MKILQSKIFLLSFCLSITFLLNAQNVQYTDTAAMLSNRLKISDTASMLVARPLNNRFLDSIAIIRSLANTRGTVFGSGTAGKVAYWGSGVEITSSANFTWDNSNNILALNGFNLKSSDVTAGLKQVQFYPNSGTNVGAAINVTPRGTGFAANLKSQIVVFNTDFAADATNYEFATLRAAGDRFFFSSGAAGTATNRPLVFSAGGVGAPSINPDQFTLFIDGRTGVNTGTNNGVDHLQVNGTLLTSGINLSGGSQAYAISKRGGTILTIQSQNSGQLQQTEYYTKDGNGTADNGFAIFAKGLPSNITNYEQLRFFYNASNQMWVIGTNKGGTGLNRTIRIGQGLAPNQLVLDTSGRTLINTTTDNGIDQLQVNGSVSATGYKVLGGTSSQFLKADGSFSMLTNPITGTGTSSQLAYWNGTSTQTGNNNLTWDNTNSVFNVSGNINSLINYNIYNASTGTNAYAYYQAQNNAGAAYQMGIAGGNTTTGGSVQANDVYFQGNASIASIILRTNNSAPIRFAINGSEVSRFSSGGRLLLNTTADDGFNKLQINGTFSATGGTLTGALNGLHGSFTGRLTSLGGEVFSGNGTTTVNPEFRFVGPNTWQWRLNSAADIVSLRRNSTDFLTLTSLGLATFSNGVTANSFIKANGTSSQILVADGSVLTAGTNVVISGGTISATGGGNSGTGATGQITYWNGANSQTGSTNLFWDNTSQSLGIGTSSPTDKLTVNGNIRAKKLTIVQNGWSDYVFYKNYKLRSLYEVEDFIKKYQHLPDVPSAKEVEEKGISVGDTQALLLRKIEEITLYMIELKKENEQLKKRVAVIEKNK